MAAPDPSLIVSDPPPLDPEAWPYRVDEFPADVLFGPLGALAPKREPKPQFDQIPASRHERQ